MVEKNRGSRVKKRNWRYFRNLLLVAIAGLVIGFYLIIPIYDANQAIHPTRYPVCCVSPTDLGLNYEEVTLSTSDGLLLSGWYIPPKNGAIIILVHAYNGNRTGVIHHADFLAQNGFGVLLFDLRAHGDSEGEVFAFGWDADKDVFAALSYLQQQPEVDPDRIGALGLSIGGEIVLQAAAQTDQIQAVVSDGAGSRMFTETMLNPNPQQWIIAPGLWVFYKAGEILSGIPAARSLQKLVTQISPRGLLLISAGQGEETALNRIYYAAAGKPKELWELPAAGHINGLFAQPEEYEEKVVTFFEQALLVEK